VIGLHKSKRREVGMKIRKLRVRLERATVALREIKV